MTKSPKSVAEYWKALPNDQREALERLRKAILAAAPGAEECLSYGLVGFRHRGRTLVHLGASAKHCAFYPGPSAIASFKKELASFDMSKGTIRFQPDAPLPAALVRKIVKARLAENAALDAKRKRKR
jgi:uncharacterized protein YdhG (YjbR/CyaY superfamily)